MASEETSNEISNEAFWKNLAVQNWYFVGIFGLIIIGAIIGCILTVNWYIDNQSIGGNGSWTFNQFSMKTALLWVIYLVLWILLLVGVPTVAVGGFIVALNWFALFPTDLKDEIKLRWKKDEEVRKTRGTKRDSGGVFSFLMFVGVCLYVYVDGNWSTEFGSLNLRYFVDAYITVFVWGLIIVGIPAAIFGITWFVKKYGRSE
ncbi:MAG: hypothetical protein ACE5R6_20505 [Candidatus Heimdallarchaeota archaeon]